MIGRLEGVLLERTPTQVLVDVNGVGYEVFVPFSTFAALPDVGKIVALRIHTHAREGALQALPHRGVIVGDEKGGGLSHARSS